MKDFRTLRECETVIGQAQRLRLAEATALRCIRDKKLYLQTHKTFDDYCRLKWGFSRQHAQRLCDMAEVGRNLSPIGVTNIIESHARPLAKLTAPQQIRAWKEISKRTGKITANSIAVMADRVQRSAATSSVIEDEDYVPTKARTPLRWFGAKIQLASKICHLIPKHKIYVEVFGGSGAVLLAKEPSKIEIYNDLHGDIVHFFRTLRTKGQELQAALKLTPYARDEHAECVANPHEGNDIERARRFFVRCRQSFNGLLDDEWSYSSTDQTGPFKHAVDLLHETADRLRNVQIDNVDFRKLLKRIRDQDDVVIFADPPYMPETRVRGDAYKHEMSGDDHCDLLEILRVYKKAKVLLCGYRCKLYDEQLKDWHRYDWKVRNNIAKYTHSSGTRTECLWTNHQH